MSQSCSKHPFQGQAELVVSKVQCVRGYRQLFSDVSFSASASDVIQVSGPNGSGKTSLLRIVAGLRLPDSGEITWQDGPSDDPTDGIFYLGHRIAMNGQLTVRENLEFLAQLEPRPAAVGLEDAMERMNIARLASLPCYLLSAGQKQRAALSALIRSSTRLWLLDEPATALDSDGVAAVEDAISKHSVAGGITLFTSHQPMSPVGVKLREYHLE